VSKTKVISYLLALLIGLSISTTFAGALSPIEVSIPEITALAGSDVTVPINVSDTTGVGVIVVEITVVYDPDILTAVDISTDGTIASGWLAIDDLGDDQIAITMIGFPPLSGAGTLVKVNFSVSITAYPGETSPLTLTDLSFWRKELPSEPVYEIVPTTTTDGIFVVDEPPASQILQLYPGQNLISTYIVAEDNDLVSVLKPIEGLYKTVWTYYTNPGWKRYTYDGDDSANDLGDIVPGAGYCIDMMGGATFVIGGEGITDADIPLAAGWNLVGYNSTTEKDINIALESIMDVLNCIYAYDNENKEWSRYSINGPEILNDLTKLKPGLSYWINVRESCSWITSPQDFHER